MASTHTNKHRLQGPFVPKEIFLQQEENKATLFASSTSSSWTGASKESTQRQSLEDITWMPRREERDDIKGKLVTPANTRDEGANASAPRRTSSAAIPDEALAIPLHLINV